MYAEHQRWLEKHRRVWEERICPECGNRFIPHCDKQICCTASCSADRNRRWKREWYHANKDRLNLKEKYKLKARERRRKEKEKRGEVTKVYDIQPSKFYGGSI